MFPASRPDSRRWIAGAAAGLVVLAPAGEIQAAPLVAAANSGWHRLALSRLVRGYENILGTSLDLIVEALGPHDAAACERRILGEIERLRRILSTYDPASEIRRVMAGGRVESDELAELLERYAEWSARTAGLVTPNLGAVIRLWREAAALGCEPQDDALWAAARQERAWNVDALGKAFIIDRAVTLARNHSWAGLLNLGGDLRAWGETAWTVAVANPRDPAENAAPLATFTLRNAAVATSGGYARNFAVGPRRYSHLIDPRSRRPLEVGGSATVVATDAVTANALSTAASIVGPGAGRALAERNGARDFLLVGRSGRTIAGGLFAVAAGPGAAPAAPPSQPAPAAPAGDPWPAGFVVTMPLTLKTHEGPKDQIFRPYLVIWIENEHGRLIRTLTLWGPDERWQRKLTMWSYQARNPRKGDPLGVTRATRAPGAYTVTWDGKDDFNRPVPAGRYKLSLEICRENGFHVLEEAELECRAESATAAWRETAEANAVTLTYGPPKP